MEKLDKEALAENIVIEFLGYKNKEEIPKWILVELFPKYKQFYEKGLEYAENHYLKLIEEKEELNQSLILSLNEAHERVKDREKELQESELIRNQLDLQSSSDGETMKELIEELQQAKKLLKEAEVNYKSVGYHTAASRIKEFLKQ